MTYKADLKASEEVPATTSKGSGTATGKGLSVNNGSDWCWLSRRARADRVVPVAVEIVAAEGHLC